MKPSSITLDATQQPLGRMASRIAYLLQGKHRVARLPHDAPAVIVTVKNSAKLAIAKKKLAQKKYHRTSGYPGAVKTERMRDAFTQDPTKVLARTVRGMLPANKHRTSYMKNLRFA